MIARSHSVRGEVTLSRRRGELELRVNGTFVMDTAHTASERALAQVALDVCSTPDRVLIGGLGLGLTTEQVLTDPRVRQVRVVEIEEALVGWMRDGTIAHGPQLLADPRVRVQVDDLLVYLSLTEPNSYEVVLLDVDNGPGQLVHLTNAALYDRTGLTLLRRVLTIGGTLVIWSAHRAPQLVRELQATVGSVRTLQVPVRLDGRAEHYWLYAATR
ncbi:MAG: hypothetical protein ACK5H2_10270 [Beutenbergiaceae bacterium]